jgi:two-component system, cell cycle response regulator
MEVGKEGDSSFKISVLIVEDDMIIQAIIRHYLTGKVTNIYLAKDGKEGLDKFKEFHPDLIITDIEMPILNGLELSSNILELYSEQIIILMTSHLESEFLIHAINLGIKGFLSKPINKDNLFQLIKKFSLEIKAKKDKIITQFRTHRILNFQETLVILTDGLKVVDVNETLLEFFQFKSKFDFLESTPTILDLIPVVEDYIYENSDNWEMSFLRSGYLQNQKIRFKSNKSNELRTFLVRYSQVPNENVYIFNLTDVTEIEAKSIKMENKAITDELTKLFNRTKFHEIFQSELTRYRTNLENLFSIIMFDIDHFKSINDTFGHNMGDIILIEISDEIKNLIRLTDLFFRWGGEEFILILPLTNKKVAQSIAEKIRKKIQEKRFSISRLVTISIGVTEIQEEDKLSTCLQRVDEALYKAKNNGRNQVVVN